MSVKVKDTMMPLGKWDFKNDSERRKKLNLLRYEALKRELLLLTAGIGTACSVYCFIQFSFEAALSYGVGVLFSCLYLQLLYYHSDNMTRDDVPEIFKQKKLKKIGIRSEDLKNTLEKTLNGCTMALSSPRLVIPAAIYGLWALSHNFVNDYFDFELVPAMFGFFAYNWHIENSTQFVCKGLCDMRANAWGLFARRNIQEGEMKSKMNYRAWSHLCWLIPYMKGTQVIDELNKSKKWSELHIADNCCFHFRRRLLFKMLEDISAREDDESCINQKTEVYFLWKEELEWNESLISRYIGREALWLHRRFLSQCYINYFTIDQGTRNSNGEDFHGVHSTLDDFLDKELELLLHSLDVTDNEFEDTQVQAQHATAYIIWISKQVPPHKHEKLQSRLQEMDLKPIMIKLCADKPHLCESPKLQLHWQHSGGIRQFIKTIVLGFELEPVQRNNSCILG